jgi:Pol polyprotein, beta-barrel domain/Integrase core domain/GAG-pre-integrase domain
MKADCRSTANKKEKEEEDKKGSGSATTATEGEEFTFTTMFAGMALVLGTSSLMGREVDVYDSGTSGHMSPDCHRFTTFKEITPCAINAADKTVFKATGMGNMRLGIPNGKTTMHITLKDVLYCADIAFTLISLTCCDAAGFSVLLKDRKCLIRDSRGTLLGLIPLSNGLYKVEHMSMAAAANVARKSLTLDELHRRMGHISPQAAQKLVQDGIMTGLDLDMASQPGLCTTCAHAKLTHKPVPQKWEGPRATSFGEKIHSDVRGPANPQSYDGKDYFINFTDEYNRWTYLVPMARKSNAFNCYKQYNTWVETQHGTKIERLQTDRGGEYLSEEFTTYLKSKGMIRSLIVHDTPEENGMSERLNRTLLEHARAMHLGADLPKFLWAESIQHAVWLKN